MPARDVHDVKGVEHVSALLSYEGDVRRLIQALKFRNRRGAIEWLALQMAACQRERDFDCVTWVPSSRVGWHRRGYEPSRLLASALGRRLGLPPVRLLRRTDSRPQSKRDRADRFDGPSLRLARRAPEARRVLLIDDVCTTGSSLAACAAVLREAGASVIHAAVVASTPRTLDVSSC